MNFSPAETADCCRLVELAIKEDLGRQSVWSGDVTTHPLFPPGYRGSATFISRAEGVLAGLPAVALVFGAFDPELEFRPLLEDGTAIHPGSRIATVSGPQRTILTSERTALNFLQHLSGVASLTRRYVDMIEGLPCHILDTRKTIPGWRLLEKYAVRCGGGHNHRIGLYDGVLIKDNHLAVARSFPKWTIAGMLRLVRKENLGEVPIGIEVESLQQLEEVIQATILPMHPEGWGGINRVDYVLLDNMSLDQLREAVRLRNARAPKIQLEASGRITLENVRAVAETGVDRISVGALTHSAPALDIALDYQPRV
jgi:nicotinate-nucleotide pyrophosphorylase (carboxylating)